MIFCIFLCFVCLSLVPVSEKKTQTLDVHEKFWKSWISQRSLGGPLKKEPLHPGTFHDWNLQITQMKLKVIFQTSIFEFHFEVSRVYTRKGLFFNFQPLFSGDMLVFGGVRSISVSVFRLPKRNKYEQLAQWTLREILGSFCIPVRSKKHDQQKSVLFSS